MNKNCILILLSLFLISCRNKNVIPLAGSTYISEDVNEDLYEPNLRIDAPDPIAIVAEEYAYDTPDYAVADVAGPVASVVTTEVSAEKDNYDTERLIQQTQNVTNVYYSDFSDNGITINNNSYTDNSYNPSYHKTINIGINLCNYPETRETICCFLNDPTTKQTVKKDLKGRVTERRFRQLPEGVYANQDLIIKYEWKENRIVRICSQTKEFEMVEVFEYNSEGYLVKATCNENVLGYISETTTRFVYTKYDSNLNWLERNLICITTSQNITRSSYFVQTRVISYHELSASSSNGQNQRPNRGSSKSDSENYGKRLYFDETVRLRGVFHAVRQPDDLSNPFYAIAKFYKMTLSVSPLTVLPLPSATKPEYRTATNIRTLYVFDYGAKADDIEKMNGRTVTVTGRLFPNPEGTGQVGIHVDKIDY